MTAAGPWALRGPGAAATDSKGGSRACPVLPQPTARSATPTVDGHRQASVAVSSTCTFRVPGTPTPGPCPPPPASAPGRPGSCLSPAGRPRPAGLGGRSCLGNPVERECRGRLHGGRPAGHQRRPRGHAGSQHAHAPQPGPWTRLRCQRDSTPFTSLLSARMARTSRRASLPALAEPTRPRRCLMTPQGRPDALRSPQRDAAAFRSPRGPGGRAQGGSAPRPPAPGGGSPACRPWRPSGGLAAPAPGLHARARRALSEAVFSAGAFTGTETRGAECVPEAPARRQEPGGGGDVGPRRLLRAGVALAEQGASGAGEGTTHCFQLGGAGTEPAPCRAVPGIGAGLRGETSVRAGFAERCPAPVCGAAGAAEAAGGASLLPREDERLSHPASLAPDESEKSQGRAPSPAPPQNGCGCGETGTARANAFTSLCKQESEVLPGSQHHVRGGGTRGRRD